MTGTGWRQAREAKGMTLRRLADAVGVSPPFLSDVEHGRRRFSAETEARVRAALGLGPAPAEPDPSCVVCEGPLKTSTWSEPVGEMVFGPGGRYVTKHSIRCPRCGLMYAHPPRSAHESEAGVSSQREDGGGSGT